MILMTMVILSSFAMKNWWKFKKLIFNEIDGLTTTINKPIYIVGLKSGNYVILQEYKKPFLDIYLIWYNLSFKDALQESLYSLKVKLKTIGNIRVLIIVKFQKLRWINRLYHQLINLRKGVGKPWLIQPQIWI